MSFNSSARCPSGVVAPVLGEDSSCSFIRRKCFVFQQLRQQLDIRFNFCRSTALVIDSCTLCLPSDGLHLAWLYASYLSSLDVSLLDEGVLYTTTTLKDSESTSIVGRHRDTQGYRGGVCIGSNVWVVRVGVYDIVVEVPHLVSATQLLSDILYRGVAVHIHSLSYLYRRAPTYRGTIETNKVAIRRSHQNLAGIHRLVDGTQEVGLYRYGHTLSLHLV